MIIKWTCKACGKSGEGSVHLAAHYGYIDKDKSYRSPHFVTVEVTSREFLEKNEREIVQGLNNIILALGA